LVDDSSRQSAGRPKPCFVDRLQERCPFWAAAAHDSVFRLLDVAFLCLIPRIRSLARLTLEDLAQFRQGLVLQLPDPFAREACSAASLPPVLHAIDVIHDCTISPTSHNLWPFEFMIIAFVSWPALLGSFISNKIRRAITARQSKI
jgi:hypothetical protein